jgi:DNA-directed RNA polymerase subunit RPC12/RpoP
MDSAKQMIAAARLLLEIAETLMDSPHQAETAAPVEELHRRPSAAPKAKTGVGKGNYPRKKKYECLACHHRFESTDALLDVTCSECSSTNIIKQPQERQL